MFFAFNPRGHSLNDGTNVAVCSSPLYANVLPPHPPADAFPFKLEDTKRNSEKLIDTLKAVLEETDIRIADLKKEAYEFKRDIVVGAENMRTGNTMAEKVTCSHS